ncbi:MAG TPA: hypothetical protein VN455_09800 [Methanotrichaceae archaeon]|nr:hypothetical protein [Methanotrichaceae archaeon]
MSNDDAGPDSRGRLRPSGDCQEGPDDLRAVLELDGLDEMPALMEELIDALDEAFDLKRSAWDTDAGERACSAGEPAHEDKEKEIARLDAELSELRSMLRSSTHRASGRS